MAFSLRWINAVELLDCFYVILKPLKRLKLPIDDLFQVIFLAVRFFPLVKEEYLRLDEGWKSFAKSSENSIKKKILNVRDRLIPLMIFSFRKAETIADSMVIRGYGSVDNRSYYSNLKFETKDIIFTLIGCVLFSSIYFNNIL
jgi:energy-coupling factor transport system permease protein